MAMFPAFLDTCTLYGAYLCDSLLRLAEAGTYRPLWSADVHFVILGFGVFRSVLAGSIPA